MSRGTIGAGMLQNNPAALSGWVENARTIKPGVLMPNQTLSGPELAAVRAYLETLR
jgi:cytochrome c oxidase subunit 2